MSSGDAYQVRLSAFEGPLDLLLFLIRRAEVDIHDIPIAEITKQYLPERLEIVEEMPRTPSGKVQKFKLRDTAKQFTAQA